MTKSEPERDAGPSGRQAGGDEGSPPQVQDSGAVRREGRRHRAGPLVSSGEGWAGKGSGAGGGCRGAGWRRLGAGGSGSAPGPLT